MPSPLLIEGFGDGDALDALVGESPQKKYLRCYLAELGASAVVVEPNYFDRDYLAEFQAFYSTSARSYTNRCKRLHFFSCPVDRVALEAAAGDDAGVKKRLQDAYLGFVVVRPIATKLGRVVLRWYDDDRRATTPRVIDPAARRYVCHLAGITLEVSGLAWQQQDSAVGGCATVALWTMLHSAAFDDAHAIPTTADITRFAHKTAALGSRVFPSHGLTRFQMLEAIKEAGLAPLVFDGEKSGGAAFGTERFATSCASLIRSGYPVVIMGRLVGPNAPPPPDNKHAVCAVGFREVAAVAPAPAKVESQDARVARLYIHDDNIGPNLRFDIVDDSGVVVMKRSVPKPATHKWMDDSHLKYPTFVPESLVTAVHDGVRTSPDVLHYRGLECARALRDALGMVGAGLGVTLSTRFSTVADYFRDLGRVVGGNARALAKARLALVESVEPMSLHVGVIRIGHAQTALVDVLLDTTDTDHAGATFCHIAFDPDVSRLSSEMHRVGMVNWGSLVEAF